jgi:hypothetical protein
MAIPEEIRVGAGIETTWGTPITTIEELPVEPPELGEEPTYIFDENVRGVLVRDFDAFQALKSTTGTLRGLWYPAELSASKGPVTIAKAFLGSEGTVTQLDSDANIPDSPIYQHLLKVSNKPSGLTVYEYIPNVSNITNSWVQYKGMVVESLRIAYALAEGFVTWETSLKGISKDETVTAPTVNSVTAGRKPLLGWASDFYQAGSVVNAKLLEFEINIERELNLLTGAAATNVPNVYASRPPRVTFRCL